MNRRSLLKGVGATSAALLAGCTGEPTGGGFEVPNVSVEIDVTPAGEDRTPSVGDATPGDPVEVTFWVTVPYTSPTGPVVLAIEGQSPLRMEPVGVTSYHARTSLPAGASVDYRYRLNGDNSASEPFTATIRTAGQRVHDGVTAWDGDEFAPAFPAGFRTGILMMDTWGRNYNFRWFESTRKNIERSFDRVSRIGSDQVRVTDFHWAVWDDGEFSLNNTDYHIEGEVFENDNRDEVMTVEDLRRLVEAAHAREMTIGWRTSFHFWDIGKYIGASDITTEVEADFAELEKPKPRDWVTDFLAKFGDLLVERATLLGELGFDELHLTPGYMTPSYQPHEALADERWSGIIDDVRDVFDGDLSYEANPFSFLEGADDDSWWASHQRYHEVDFVYLPFYNLEPENTVPDPTYEDMVSGLNRYLDDVERGNESHGVGLALEARLASFEDAINHPPVEFNDVGNPAVRSLQRDWQHQAECFEALFRALEGREGFRKVDFAGYWWDNAMDPDTATPFISKSPSPRNKPAEAVFAKWAGAIG